MRLENPNLALDEQSGQCSADNSEQPAKSNQVSRTRLKYCAVGELSIDWDSQAQYFNWSACPYAARHSRNGTWIFKDTEVPLRFLFENLADGQSPEEFIQMFPGVTAEAIQPVMHFAQHCLGQTKSR